MDSLLILNDTLFTRSLSNFGLSDSVQIIIKNSNTNNSVIPILSALTAILAVFVGPTIQLFINRKQSQNQNQILERSFENQRKLREEEIKQKFIAESRLKWIESIRDLFSEFQGSMTLQALHYKTSQKFESAEFSKIFIDTTKLIAKIELNLNPTEKSHEEIIHLMKNINMLATKKDRDKDLWDKQEEFIQAAGKILKIEWEKAKRMV